MFGLFRRRLKRSDMPAGGPVGAFVLSSDVAREGRYARSEAAELIARVGCVWVAVAVSRTCNAVAGTPLRVMRRKRNGSTMSGRTLSRVVRRSLLQSPSLSGLARKALESGMDYEVVDDHQHPLCALLESGWPGGSGYDLLSAFEGYRSITGNGYIALVPGTLGYPVEAWPIPSQFVRVVPSKTMLVDHYIIGRSPENDRPWPREMVLHLKANNWGGDPYYGLGDLASVWKDADTVKALTQFTLAHLDNAVIPGMVVWNPNLDHKQREELTWRLRAFQGVGNAFKSLIFGGSSKPEVLKWDTGLPSGFSFVQDDAIIRDRIANAFDLPVSLLTQDTAALAQAKTAITHWMTMSIGPRCRRIEDRLNESLVPLFREALGDDSLIVCFDNPVKSDPDEANARAIAACGGPYRTVNEVRADMMLPPIEGGDVLRGDPSAPAFDLPTLPVQQDAAKGGVPEVVTKSAGVVRKTSDDVIWSPAPVTCCDHAPRTKRAINAKAMIETTEAKLHAALRSYFSSLFPVVDPIVERGVAMVISPEDLSPAREKFIKAVEPHIYALVGTGYVRGYGELPDPGNAPPWVDTEEFARNAVLTYSRRLESSVAGTAARRVTKVIAEGIASGATVDEQRQAVRQLLEVDSGPAAERIARTESARALLSGRREAWKLSGLVKHREWLLSGNPCPVCRAMAEKFRSWPIDRAMVGVGEEVPGSDGVTNTYGDIDGPPAHPNCSCSEGAVFEEGSDEAD